MSTQFTETEPQPIDPKEFYLQRGEMDCGKLYDFWQEMHSCAVYNWKNDLTTLEWALSDFVKNHPDNAPKAIQLQSRVSQLVGVLGRFYDLIDNEVVTSEEALNILDAPK